MPDTLADFERAKVTLHGTTKLVYRKGTGPAVIVMSEMPGITPKVADFARAVANNGCTVVMPHLFGRDGVPPSSGAYLRAIAQVCISREFTLFARGESNPVTGWLRELARTEHERCGGPGVGAVGMCLTGGFALALMVEPSVIAPVLSQPSLPSRLGPFLARNESDLNVSDADLATVKRRMVDEDICMLGYRYSDDPLSPAARFERLTQEFGDRFIGTTFPSASKKDHSVLTEHLQQQAFDEVLAFFRTRLHPAS